MVKIGNQTWMAENLNYKTSGSYCDSCEEYGRLYTWDEAQKVCPAGWHLPSKKEFETLIRTVGGDSVAGKKLKSESGWDCCDAADPYGFGALPAGYHECYSDSIRGGHYAATYFWSIAESGSEHAYALGVTSCT